MKKEGKRLRGEEAKREKSVLLLFASRPFYLFPS
jgi:hypothetical protein